MRIIPVIDLLDGTVVHAKQGQRKLYQPIVSSLTTSSKPLDIVKAFMEIYPFETLYIADLNAIQRLNTAAGDDHLAIIANIQNTFPNLLIWLDAGIRDFSDTKRWQSQEISLVIGTESIVSVAEYQTILNRLRHKVVLSLDFMPNGYQGDEAFIQNSQEWPQHVIVMTLNHVGSDFGIATQQLSKLAKLSHHHHLFAAGGVRDIEDIRQLQQLGIQGALVATALHTQKINSTTLNAIKPMQRKKPE